MPTTELIIPYFLFSSGGIASLAGTWEHHDIGCRGRQPGVSTALWFNQEAEGHPWRSPPGMFLGWLGPREVTYKPQCTARFCPMVGISQVGPCSQRHCCAQAAADRSNSSSQVCRGTRETEVR